MSTLSATGRRSGFSEGLNALLHPHPVAVVGAERVARRFRRAPQRHRPPLSLSHRQSPRAAHVRARPRLAGEADASTRRPCTRRRARSSGGTISPPSAIRSARRNRRSAPSTGSTSGARATTILFEASARSFLHRQVRSMVGSLVEVGAGRWSAGEFKAAFEAADRSRCGQVAPAASASISSAGATIDRANRERNNARARAHRCATAPRDRRARPARRRRGWSR